MSLGGLFLSSLLHIEVLAVEKTFKKVKEKFCYIVRIFYFCRQKVYVQGPETPVQGPWTYVQGPETGNILRGKKKYIGEKKKIFRRAKKNTTKKRYIIK